MRHDERLSEIENEISRTRQHMDATLHAIEERLTPGQLVDQGLDYLRHSGANEFVSNLGSSVKQNPLPVTFVAVGIAWLMMMSGQQRSGGAAGRLSEAAGSAGSRVAESTRRAGATASDAAQNLREHARRSAEAARDQFERARSGYQRLREEQPLALGVLGLAMGAAMALAVPRTRQEDEWMGEASNRLAEKARETGREQMERAQEVAAAARDAAMAQASRQSQTEVSGRQREDTRRESAAEREPQRPAAPGTK